MDLYTTLKKIGSGTFGTVYLCQRKHNLQKLVMKVINDDMNEKEISTAKNEVAILKALKHPNIVQYYDSVLKKGKFYILMEYADQGTLHKMILERKQLNNYFVQEDVLTLFCQVVTALNYIHGRNIIHRDLKSENIFLAGRNGRTIKIGDFGISKILLDDLKQTRTTIGTTNYIAPEICDGNAYDTKSDIWSLGCILYEICSLERLFSGTLSNIVMSIKGGYKKQINLTMYDPVLQDIIGNTVLINPEERLTTSQILRSNLFSQAYLNIMLNEGNEY